MGKPWIVRDDFHWSRTAGVTTVPSASTAVTGAAIPKNVIESIHSLEALRYVAPGEWGKLMGLDRIREVCTLRQKITELCAEQGR